MSFYTVMSWQLLIVIDDYKLEIRTLIIWLADVAKELEHNTNTSVPIWSTGSLWHIYKLVSYILRSSNQVQTRRKADRFPPWSSPLPPANSRDSIGTFSQILLLDSMVRRWQLLPAPVLMSEMWLKTKAYGNSCVTPHGLPLHWKKPKAWFHLLPLVGSTNSMLTPTL